MEDVRIQLSKDNALVKKIIEDNHYSHKIPQAIKYRFVFYIKEDIKGVAVFSIPANMYSITSIFKNETQHIGIELSRVFTDDDTPKNFESYCLSKCFDYIKNNTVYDVIVSYADPNFEHRGFLYQALNAKYLGETGGEIRYLVNGQLITRRGLGRSHGDTEKEHVQRLLLDGGTKVKMKGKHKYLFFTCDKRRQKQLIGNLKDNVCLNNKYPK